MVDFKDLKDAPDNINQYMEENKDELESLITDFLIDKKIHPSIGKCILASLASKFCALEIIMFCVKNQGNVEEIAKELEEIIDIEIKTFRNNIENWIGILINNQND